jgi:hypothetical protein
VIAAAGLESRQRTIFVRSFRTCARIRSLTTGTFNQVVKDRSTIRLSGAHSVQIESLCRALRRWADRSVRPTHRFRLSSKPYKHTAPRKVASTLTSHRISTGFPHWESEEPQGLKPGPLWEGFRGTTKVVPSRSCSEYATALLQRATVWPSAWRNMRVRRTIFTHARTEDRKLRKDPIWRSLL